jgi:lipopolysaccharide transport system ATP-binding protein
MMSIIEVKSVGKKYHKGVDRRYKSLRESLGDWKDLWSGNRKESFWALEDITFDVAPGESLGIIGRNGAGKSTLLKILARITPPTKGEIILRGRVASLLEVGTGFHPELTGRENIFFNGSILGMRYHEIKGKFDEIVEFSGVGTFLDTPLKHYSSGMQMRLAFSVAAHLRAEILLIDEVLAVGDAEFQKKCLGKMDEVSQSEGKTILFVSHDLSSVSKLTRQSVFLEGGVIINKGETDQMISEYESSFSRNMVQSLHHFPREGNSRVIIKEIKIYPADDIESGKIASFSDILVELQLENIHSEKIHQLKVDLGINNFLGRRISWLTVSPSLIQINGSTISLKIKIHQIPLCAGEYNFNIHLEVNHQTADWLKNVGYLKIEEDEHKPFRKYNPSVHGDILLKYDII